MENNTFLEGKIAAPLIRFAIPLMMSLVLQALYGGVDLMVVGKFGTTASISAVATGGQVMQAATVIITGLTMGVTVLLGQAIGAKKPEEAAHIVAGQIKLFTCIALMITVVLVCFAKQASLLMHVPEEALPETITYIRICASGMIFITAYNSVSGIFRGMGNSRSPFLFVLIACTINIILDLVFVGLLHMSTAGAALATVIAQASSFFFSIVYMKYTKKHRLPFRLKLSDFKQKGAVRRIISLGQRWHCGKTFCFPGVGTYEFHVCPFRFRCAERWGKQHQPRHKGILCSGKNLLLLRIYGIPADIPARGFSGIYLYQ